MKIIQIASLVTPDGAYGGPVRVAVNQTRALLAAGHDVVLAAGARGYKGSLPDTFDGVPVKLFRAPSLIPRLGFAGVVAPGLQNWLGKTINSADVLHVHMSRDLVTLPSALLAARRKIPYVLQTHGMVGPSLHPLARPLDAAWTTPALRHADRIFYLTSVERKGLEEIGPPSLKLQELRNGVPDLPSSPQTPGSLLEVLFLARLHKRKRPLMFIDMAKRLHRKFPNARFVLVGPDEGEGQAVRTAINDANLEGVITWEGAVSPEESADRISRCTVYVLPSVDEPFPMSVLEAMRLGKPVIVTETCGLAASIARNGAGVVTDASLGSLTDAVEGLLASLSERTRAGGNAQRLAINEFGMRGVVKTLSKCYEEVSEHRTR